MTGTMVPYIALLHLVTFALLQAQLASCVLPAQSEREPTRHNLLETRSFMEADTQEPGLPLKKPFCRYSSAGHTRKHQYFSFELGLPWNDWWDLCQRGLLYAIEHNCRERGLKLVPDEAPSLAPGRVCLHEFEIQIPNPSSRAVNPSAAATCILNTLSCFGADKERPLECVRLIVARSPRKRFVSHSLDPAIARGGALAESKKSAAVSLSLKSSAILRMTEHMDIAQPDRIIKLLVNTPGLLHTIMPVIFEKLIRPLKPPFPFRQTLEDISRYIQLGRQVSRILYHIPKQN